MNKNINFVFYSDWQRSDSDFKKWEKTFKQKDPKINLMKPSHPNSYSANVALVWEPPKGLLKKFKNLKGVINLGQGVDHLVKPGVVPRNLPIIRLVDPEMSKTIAAWTSLQILQEVCDYKTYPFQQKNKIWKGHPIENSSFNWKIGILGLGAIGSYVAKSLIPFGFKIYGWSRTQKFIKNIESFSGEEGFKKVLSNSRILICLLPLTSFTKYILNDKSLKLLPKGSTVINAGRGKHINENDLLKLIESGHIKNAYLDVFEKEPLPSNHPFWNHKNITVWPHVAGQTNRETSINQIIDAAYCLVNDKKAPNTISKQKEY